jgi:DNA-binding SARP family transcriptional activator/LysM repeat protein
MRPPSRFGELARGLGALAVLLLLLAGLPTGLLLVAGSPIPHSLPDWTQITTTLMQPDTGNTLFLAVVKVIGWGAWSLFTLITLTETAGYLRGRPARRLPGPLRPMQHLARDLVATTALIISTGAPLTGTATAPLTHQTIAVTDHTDMPVSKAAADVLAVGTASGGAQRPVMLAAAQAPPKASRTWRTHVIKRGDTLWAIARHTYGAGRQYPRIFNASKGLSQPHELPRLTDPDRLYPGQRIKIPLTGDETKSRTRRVHPDKRAPVSPTPLPPEPSQTAGPPAVSSPPDSAPSAPETPTTRPSTAHTPSSSSATAPAPGGHPRPASPPRNTSPAPHSGDESPQDAPTVISLPTGARIGMGLAAAISVALAATRLHRRRRRPRTEQWPDPTAAETGPATPEPVARAHKAHLDAYTASGERAPSDIELVARQVTAPAPTHLDIGIRDGRHLTAELAGLNLALTGPGALDTARAIVTELLARSHRYHVQIVIPSPDAATLLAGTGIDAAELATQLPGLTLTPSLEAAIAHLEAEFIHRARLMETLDEPDVPALRSADPGEPLPGLILVTSTSTGSGDGLQAILRLGRRYCVGALLLGDGHATTALTLADDGSVTEVHGPEAENWNDARLFHLTPADTGAMIRTIQTANGAPEPPTPPDAGHDAAPGPVRSPHAVPAEHTTSSTSHRQAASASEPASPPVRLRLLGTVRIEAAGVPVATGLRRIARDLLTYLALHPDGVTRDQGIDALMPDRDLDTGTTMIHTAINNARKTLRRTTGLSEPMFIIHTGGHYHLDPELFDVDLWRLEAALHDAQHATTEAARIKMLQEVPELYAGEFADDLTYEWAETERERLRRQATDGLAHLARLLTDAHPDQALAALEHALGHDPYAEPLYRAVMELQARLGRPDAVRRTYQLLTSRLADLDTEPSEETHQLHLRLLRPPVATPGGCRIRK